MQIDSHAKPQDNFCKGVQFHQPDKLVAAFIHNELKRVASLRPTLELRLTIKLLFKRFKIKLLSQLNKKKS